ncbi:MAG: four helix bundle protein [Clostridiales bacterium]|nr:four helix bundle protein [Clostridiales bacterium]
MNSFGRNKNVGLPNIIPRNEETKECINSKIEIAKAVAQANKKTYKKIDDFTEDSKKINKEMQIRNDTSELIVITKTKKLAAYVITVTEKSPKKFRAVFVNRLQNYCLDCIEQLIEANSLKMDSIKNKERRKSCQHAAFLKLKLLSYMSFLALENECILKKQYEQISLQLSDCINLLIAWRKSDALRHTH